MYVRESVLQNVLLTLLNTDDYLSVLIFVEFEFKLLERTITPSHSHYVLEQLLSHPWVVGDKAKDDAMDPEIVSRLQSFNARRKLRAAAIASVWSSTIFLRTKKLKSLVGTHDLTEEEIENLRINFKKM